VLFSTNSTDSGIKISDSCRVLKNMTVKQLIEPRGIVVMQQFHEADWYSDLTWFEVLMQNLALCSLWHSQFDGCLHCWYRCVGLLYRRYEQLSIVCCWKYKTGPAGGLVFRGKFLVLSVLLSWTTFKQEKSGHYEVVRVASDSIQKRRGKVGEFVNYVDYDGEHVA